METMAKYIERNGIEFTAEAIPARTDGMARNFRGASHWHCTITARPGGQAHTLEIEFSQGPAHTAPPEAVDVLNCLADDAAGIENAADVWDWLEEYGYSGTVAEMREAARSYELGREQTAQLREVLGAEEYERLLWETERL